MERIKKLKGNRMAFILFTTFLNFLGFSIIIPVLPFIIQKYEPHTNDIALYVGLLMSSYALCQFFAAPGLGMLSDRFGRRPILLISLFGSVIGYLFLGIGGSLTIIFLGRVIDGLTGGNISTIYAYIADITEPKDRGKYFGYLGAAGGLGFMFGPAIGGLVSTISLSAPLFLAAIVTSLSIIWGYFVLPESLKKEHRLKKFELSHLNPFSQFSHLLSIPVLRVFLSISFLYFFASTMLQGNFSVYLKDILNFGPGNIGLVLFVVGLMDIFSQGFLSSRLIPILGDFKLTVIGLFLSIIGFIIVGSIFYFHSAILLYLAVIVANLGDGLFQPAFSGLISKSVEPRMQGRIQGVNQSIQSISRVTGPLAGAFLYQYGKSLPYFSGAMVIAFSLFLFLFFFSTIKNHGYHA
jgi:MFS transporter, DHA1 family, tetracycline resistance protein